MSDENFKTQKQETDAHMEDLQIDLQKLNLDVSSVEIVFVDLEANLRSGFYVQTVEDK